MLVPFYHGAIRYLDEAHRPPALLVSWRVLLDFFLLFAEAVALFYLASSVTEPLRFAYTAGVLLGVDIGWAAIALTRAGPWQGPVRAWVCINLPALVVVLALAAVLPLFAVQPCVFAVFALRAVLDYKFAHAIYFPPGEPQQRTALRAAP